MRILLVIPALSPVYGGPSRIALSLAAALTRRGMHVDLVTTDADGLNWLDVPHERWTEQDGFRVRYFRRNGRREYKFSLSLFRWLLRRAGDYDVTHVTSSFNFPVAASALACRLRGTPYILAPQGMLEPWALGYRAGKKRLYLRLVERPFVLRGARLIQALNSAEAANIRSLQLGPSIVTLPNGIDPGETAHATAEDREAFFTRFPAARHKTVILFLHRVDPKKGLDLLAPAYAMVRSRFVNTHLIVAGPSTGTFEKTAREYFHAVGVAGNVTFTGMLDGALKRGAFGVAQIFVAPSYSEGFSISVLEAMAAGLPCAITKGCNFPEAAVAGAVRETEPNAGQFAAALLTFLENPESAREMGARARALVLAGYTWDQIAVRFEAILRNMILT